MNRRTLLIAGGVSVAVLVLWYLLLWSPRKGELSDAKADRETAETERDTLAARVDRLKASQKDEPLKRAQVEALRTTVPDEPNLAAFILDTNDAAAKAGIDWISIAPSEPAPATPGAAISTVAAAQTAPAAPAAPAASAAPPAEIKLTMQITGGYFQVLDFLNRVNDMPRLVVTDGLNVTSDEKAKLTVGVTARMFVRTVPPGYGDVPAAPVTTPTTAAPAAPAAAPSTPPSTTSAAPAAGTTPTGARS